jgi:sigma-E factor negative regulatory protein RseA
MSQEIREQLSTLMDGELARDETLFLMRRISNDGRLVQRWSSYHVARQVLRRQDFFVMPDDFSSQILARIDAEGVSLTSQSGRWIRWAGGGAIAASVAVVALMFSSPQNGNREAPGEPLAASTNSMSQPVLAAPSRPVEFRPPLAAPALDVQPASASTDGFSSSPTPIDPRLQSYLIRHYDAAASNGQSAMMPYILLVVPPQQSAQTTAGQAVNGVVERR